MDTCILVVGSNYGDSEKKVTEALLWLSLNWRIVRRSEIYQTPDFLGSGSMYHNAVIEIETTDLLSELSSKIKDYEVMAGRSAELKKLGKVAIDIDIVARNGEIIREKDYRSSYFRKGYEALASV